MRLVKETLRRDTISQKEHEEGRVDAFLGDLPVVQMRSMVLAHSSLLGERNIKSGHDRGNWAFMSILNHNLAIPLSPFGCLPSAV